VLDTREPAAAIRVCLLTGAGPSHGLSGGAWCLTSDEVVSPCQGVSYRWSMW
jgi:hypothetical protein